MADNTVLSTAVGTGDSIRTEDRTTFKTPVSLIDVGGTSAEALIGDSGVAMPVRGLSAEDAAATGAPVPAGGRYDATPRSLEDGDRGEIALDVAGQQLTVVSSSALPTGAATSAKQDTGNTSLSNLDGKVTACNTGAVVIASGTVELGATALAALETITVASVTAAIPAGNNNIGDVDVASIAAGNNNIGDVDIASIAAGDNNIGNVDIVTVPSDPFGTNADAASGTGSISAKLRQIAVNGIPVTNAGTFATQVDGSALTALQKIDDPVLVDDAAFTPATSSVSMAGFQADETATDSVDEGDAGAARMTLDRKQITTAQPHTKGGLLIFKSTDIDETEEDVKTSAGQLYALYCVNTNASARYLKVYNLTAANVTVGSSTPVMDLLVPPSNGGFYLQWPTGVEFDTAICLAATTGVGASDSGAPGANEVQVHAYYK